MFRSISRSFSLLLRETRLSRVLPAAGYKSALSLDNLYPKSTLDCGNVPTIKHTYSSGDNFSGFIPIEKLAIKYLRSGGPGGQNVNKVSSKAEVRFHLDSADWIPEKSRQRLKEMYHTRINKIGEFIVVSDRTRVQMLNLADCLDKIRFAVREAEFEPSEPSEEDKQAMKARILKLKRATLREKRSRSLTKQSRGGAPPT
ncbi:PREDICTED: peptidyl-tRNA hydrolase ICT1, mitochondrial-like [Priapulus caudatus]|uniref:Large ribosomal subunit protein mL62 n=1 Tax=Priapulus caudatus TaxID=37621 RepID=A0ABM1FAH9_PRICU|nr:PREDICTED: peptidyl-tRNA hydrolase ICT1, mitochondrial-like [Priapulus caudatus]